MRCFNKFSKDVQLTYFLIAEWYSVCRKVAQVKQDLKCNPLPAIVNIFWSAIVSTCICICVFLQHLIMLWLAMVLIYLWEMNLLVWITKWNRQTLGSCDDDHETIRQNFPRLLDFQDFQGPELRLSADIKHGSGYNLLLRQHCWHCSKLSLLSLQFTLKTMLKQLYIYTFHWALMCLGSLSAYTYIYSALKY